MATRIRIHHQSTRRLPTPMPELHTQDVPDPTDTSDTDDLLDEIDAVLEENTPST